MSIILASKSPRRREILSAVGLSFTVVTADTDESCNETDAALLVEELSRRKAEEVQKILVQRGQFHPDDIVIGCDTVVCCDKTVLGKPKDREDAKRMLRLLSGREHRVVSGLTLLTDRIG